ncbi:unnamed protein product, partial [marine sediment metagenome]
MKIRPIGEKILVKRLEAEKKTKGGIVLPDTAKEKPKQGKVIAVGEGKLMDDGSKAKFQVKKGDRILFASYAGTEVKVDFYKGRTKLESKARLLIGLTLVLLLGAIFVIIERTHSELLFQRIHERSALTARELLLFIETSGVDVNDLTETRRRLKAYLNRIHPSPAYTVRLISGRSAEG